MLVLPHLVGPFSIYTPTFTLANAKNFDSMEADNSTAFNNIGGQGLAL
ncbi:hypothetical protein [Corynebacterium epidermidicanis]|uniref:Uncharacterized protein n=1 Tax=Corynebacterium epidermidicanis TaxID=1050174 RepID=A0A0G3GP54_9CORY|nr:hypothetical protein [Corynebacterium epidermidicanis]AKK02340.1 hypothetical protein CEPID_02295 [Corynebacterium epidermidicanis]